jgi:hypothetical protein
MPSSLGRVLGFEGCGLCGLGVGRGCARVYFCSGSSAPTPNPKLPSPAHYLLTPASHLNPLLSPLHSPLPAPPQGKGPAAVAMRDMCIRMRRECLALSGGAASGGPLAGAGAAGGSSGTPLISRAVILDREVDVITPMMTQITFEGLIDEVTGIKNGVVPWVPKGEEGRGGRSGGGPWTQPL